MLVRLMSPKRRYKAAEKGLHLQYTCTLIFTYLYEYFETYTLVVFAFIFVFVLFYFI